MALPCAFEQLNVGGAGLVPAADYRIDSDTSKIHVASGGDYRTDWSVKFRSILPALVVLGCAPHVEDGSDDSDTFVVAASEESDGSEGERDDGSSSDDAAEQMDYVCNERPFDSFDDQQACLLACVGEGASCNTGLLPSFCQGWDTPACEDECRTSRSDCQAECDGSPYEDICLESCELAEGECFHACSVEADEQRSCCEGACCSTDSVNGQVHGCI
jgi:hypothetical protein